MPIAEAARQIAARALSPVALAEAYLARIAAIDPQLNAYITVTTDLALQQASAADAELQRGVNRGRLHGIPFGMKDMVDTAGILTTAHSRLLAHNYPARDAAVVDRLRQAGAVCWGSMRRMNSRMVGHPSICLGRRHAIPGIPRTIPTDPAAVRLPLLPVGWRRWRSAPTRAVLSAARHSCAERWG
jgi:hypothetical protein